jgi:RNA polymerase primary sigma factor
MGMLLLDLIQEANLGLWQGVQNGAGLSEENCVWWIRHYLSRAVVLQAKAAGIGQKMRQAMEDYRSVDERLLSELGRNPTTEEIADALHMTVSETEAVAEMLENVQMMQRIKTPEKEEQPQEEDQAVEDTAYFQMRQRISDLLSGLEPWQAELITLRYGLEGGIPMKPEQVAQKLNMTVAEVVAAEADALSKLRTNN